MQEFLKADIFFFVTTLAVVLVTILVLVILFLIVKILKNVKDISDTAKHEAENISEDIATARMKVKAEGVKLKHFTDIFGGFMARKAKRHTADMIRKRKKKKKGSDEEG